MNDRYLAAGGSASSHYATAAAGSRLPWRSVVNIPGVDYECDFAHTGPESSGPVEGNSRRALDLGGSIVVPDISVIIPTYHREAQLLEAIGSILSQRDVSFEIIVIDDSGSGSARDAVASIGDARIQYVQRAEPSGGAPALVRNEGALMAQGRYLYFLDDDDLLEPGTLAVMSKTLDASPAAGMAFGVVEPFGADEAKLRDHVTYFREARRIARRLRGRRELAAALVFRPSILVNSACMGRRTAFIDAGGYDVRIPVCEDADLWGRIAQATGSIFIDRPVVRYRTGAPSLMQNLAAQDEKLTISYRRIQGKYRRTHGLFTFLVMKIWARAMLG